MRTRVVKPAEELDGVRSAEVPCPDLHPDQLAGVGIGHVDGDVGVVSRGGEGIVLVAPAVLFPLPADVVQGVCAHIEIHIPVSTEFPAQQGLILQAEGAVGAVPNLDGDGLHVAEYRPHLDGAGVGAFVLLPFDIPVVGQPVDEFRIQFHRGGAGAAGYVRDPIGAAIAADGLDPHQPRHLRAAETGDGEVVPGV